jgi:hypothetical protein
MGYIKINTKYPVYDGAPITFRAPCDCTAADGISVNSKNFVFKDAHGVALTGMGNLFLKDAVVKVILDVTNGCAYIQNADTNSYLENKDADCVVNYYGTETEYIDIPGATSAAYVRWYVREWKSGRVECFGDLNVGGVNLVGGIPGIYGCKPTDDAIFSNLPLPVALDSTKPTTINATLSSGMACSYVMISLGKMRVGYDPDSNKLLITNTPEANVWSPVEQSLSDIRVSYYVSGQKAY